MAAAADVARSIGRLAKLYGRELDADTIEFYAEVLLRRLSADEACSAIGLWATRETRWPAPGQIIALVHPEVEAKDQAAELAQRLRSAIARRGYTWEDTFRYDGHASVEEAIRSELGPEALAVVERAGGWRAFCREWGGEDGDIAARAQLRQVCAVALRDSGATAMLEQKNTLGIES